MLSIIKEESEVFGNRLKCKIYLQREDVRSATGEMHLMHDNSVTIQFHCLETSELNMAVFVNLYRFKKEKEYRFNIRSSKLRILNKILTTVDNDAWYKIYNDHYGNLEYFDLEAIVDVIEHHSLTLSVIHEDTEMTDFEMIGVDGSVRMHRLVLAAASPVLGRMLNGEWREAASGRVELPGTTRETLKHLKDFIYLGVLPESGLQPLLQLAACYMMLELESRCLLALVDSLTSDTAYECLEYAISNKLTKLVNKILERVACGAINMYVADIKTPSETS